jgi:hypothetical protein
MKNIVVGDFRKTWLVPVEYIGGDLLADFVIVQNSPSPEIQASVLEVNIVGL